MTHYLYGGVVGMTNRFLKFLICFTIANAKCSPTLFAEFENTSLFSNGAISKIDEIRVATSILVHLDIDVHCNASQRIVYIVQSVTCVIDRTTTKISAFTM